MNILFMCVANAARSQMAEGLARQIFAGRAEIQSAGSKPKEVHPLAKKVLEEVHIDISGHFSKSCDQLPENFTQNLDYLITLCADEVCPVTRFTSAKKLHWPLKDPASSAFSDLEQLQAFRFTRDEIQKKLMAFAKTI